jgi:hypothetical protein
MGTTTQQSLYRPAALPSRLLDAGRQRALALLNGTECRRGQSSEYAVARAGDFLSRTGAVDRFLVTHVTGRLMGVVPADFRIESFAADALYVFVPHTWYQPRGLGKVGYNVAAAATPWCGIELAVLALLLAFLAYVVFDLLDGAALLRDWIGVDWSVLGLAGTLGGAVWRGVRNRWLLEAVLGSGSGASDAAK